MSGFRQPEQLRGQMVLWNQRLDDAIPVDHPVRHFDHLLRSDAFADTFTRYSPAFEPPQPEGPSNYGAESGFTTGRTPPPPSGCNPPKPQEKRATFRPSGSNAGEGAVAVPSSVRIQAEEFAIGRPDCSRDDVINHLGLGVPLEVANAAIDELAESEERFAMLQREVVA